VTGNVAPDIVNAVPKSAAELTVTGAFPEEVRLSDLDDFEFTDMLPKSRLLELTASCRLAASVPMPLRPTVFVPSEELLEMVIVAVAAPAAVGLKDTWMVMASPVFSVAGNEVPVTVNSFPARVTELTVTAAVPVEVKVIVLEDVEFSVTLPKSRLFALTVRWMVV